MPSSPTLTSTVTVLPSKAALVSLAVARRTASRLAMLLRRSSSCLRLPLVAATASFLGNRKFSSVTLSDLYDVTLAALALDLIEKNNLHDASPFLAAVAVATEETTGTVYGRRAISRARLMALAMSC